MFRFLKSSRMQVLLFTGLIAAASICSRAATPASQANAAKKSEAAQNYGNLPLSFEANQGQSDGQVRFVSRGRDYALFLTDSAAVLSLSQPKSASSGKSQNAPNRPAEAESVRMQLAGANPQVRITGADQLPGVYNYFLGNDPAKWRTNIPTYAKVQYSDIYPGIDLIYYGNQRQLEYDFVVAPGTSPNAIRLNFAGQRRLQLAADGDLILQGTNGQATLHKPIVYQEKDGQRSTISASFQLAANHSVRFRIGSYDHTRALVIDPVLVYSTYLGGTGGDEVYVYRGGDRGYAIAVDSGGSAYIAGSTSSPDFPVTSGAYQSGNKAEAASNGTTAFVSKLNAAGTALVYSTYIGGSGLESFGDYGLAIALDAQNNVYIGGITSSADFPITPGAFQATNLEYQLGLETGFVTKLNAAGSALLYSTYLGGLGGEYNGEPSDAVYALAVDSLGDAYATGETSAQNFPVTPGTLQQKIDASMGGFASAFVTKFNPTGTKLLYSTYLGGSGNYPGANQYPGDYGQSIAIDGSGNAYVAGRTGSVDFPTTPGAFQIVNMGADCLKNPKAACGGYNGFVAKLNPAATELIYSTYLGGNGAGPGSAVVTTDAANAIAIDAAGDAYVAGITNSLNFPITAGALSQTGDPNGAGFVAKLNPAGSALVYSTYLGNGNAGVVSLALDGAGKTYLTGYAPGGLTPTADAIPSQSCCAYLAKLNAAATAVEYASYLGGTPANSTVSQAIALDASGSVYVSGYTLSLNFPVTTGAIQSTNKGTNNLPNAFAAKLALAGETTDHFGTVTALTGSGATSQSGQPYTLTAAVAVPPGTSVPTGHVTFSGSHFVPNQQGVAITPVTQSLNPSGIAAWTTSSLALGLYEITASYAGDATHLASGSNVVGFVVDGPPAQIAIREFGSGGSFVYGNPNDLDYLGVNVTDSVGDQLSGITVNFSGTGLSFSPASVTTDYIGNSGEVTAIPTQPGMLTAIASVAGSTLTFAFPTFTVTPAPLTVTLHGHWRIYGAPNPSFLPTFTGLVGSDTVTVTPQTTATTASPIGSYPVTATVTGPAAAKYNISVIPATLNIFKALLHISAKNVAVTYGQTPPQPTAYNLTGFVNGDTSSVVSGAPVLSTTVTATTPAGSYLIGVQVGSLTAANYSFSTLASGEGSATVYKAPLTIRPNNFTIHAGDPLPTFTYTLTGFVNGDTQASATTGTPTLTTGAPNTNTPGRYYIVANSGSLAAHNYYFNQPSAATDGILTILPN